MAYSIQMLMLETRLGVSCLQGEILLAELGVHTKWMVQTRDSENCICDEVLGGFDRGRTANCIFSAEHVLMQPCGFFFWTVSRSFLHLDAAREGALHNKTHVAGGRK